MGLLRTMAGVMAMPLALSLSIGLLGLFAMALKRPRQAKILLFVAACIAWLASTSPIAGLLIGPLERRHPPLAATAPLPPVATVVVLGSGYAPRDGIPVTAALDEDGLARVVEGVRLARGIAQPRLVLSGGAEPGRVPVAQGYALLAAALGVSPASLVVLPEPSNTFAEAQALRSVVGSAPFLLVTSAYHMPRAMLLMQQAGLHALAAPTGQRLGSGAAGWRGLLPGSASLRSSERALHEYLALAAMRMGLT